MKNYFRLNTYCYLVGGVVGGCIYNLSTGDMISIDSDKYELLDYCENNMSLDQMEVYDRTFLDELNRNNIGMYYDTPVYIDKYYIGHHPQMERLLLPNYAIGNAFVELDTMCNFNCVFCGTDDNVLFRKTGCKRWKTKNRISDLGVWKDIIRQIAKLGCKQITFIGGEPFLRINELKDLIPYIKSQGISDILVFTNGSLMNDDIMSLIKSYDVELSIQVLASSNEVYTQITKVQDVKVAVEDNIIRLIANDIKFTLSYLISRFNESEVQDAFEKYTTLAGNRNIRLEYIYPVPHNNYYSKLFMDMMYDRKNTFMKVDVSKFCYAAKYHNCFGSGIAITADGNLLPCIMARPLVLGNVNNQSIVSILADSKYEYYRGLTKDKIEGCKECAYRYGCLDCRALEMSATNDVEGLEYCSLKCAKRYLAEPIGLMQPE